MLESSVERKLITGSKQKGCIALKLYPNPSGLPDRLILLPRGRCVFVEVKQAHGHGRLRPIQKAIHSRLQILGFRVYTLFGADDVSWFLDDELPDLIQSESDLSIPPRQPPRPVRGSQGEDPR